MRKSWGACAPPTVLLLQLLQSVLFFFFFLALKISEGFPRYFFVLLLLPCSSPGLCGGMTWPPLSVMTREMLALRPGVGALLRGKKKKLLEAGFLGAPVCVWGGWLSLEGVVQGEACLEARGGEVQIWCLQEPKVSANCKTAR